MGYEAVWLCARRVLEASPGALGRFLHLAGGALGAREPGLSRMIRSSRFHGYRVCLRSRRWCLVAACGPITMSSLRSQWPFSIGCMVATRFRYVVWCRAVHRGGSFVVFATTSSKVLHGWMAGTWIVASFANFLDWIYIAMEQGKWLSRWDVRLECLRRRPLATQQMHSVFLLSGDCRDLCGAVLLDDE